MLDSQKSMIPETQDISPQISPTPSPIQTLSPEEECTDPDLWSMFAERYPEHGSFISDCSQSITLNDFDTIPVSMTLPDDTVISDYWAACDPLHNWMARHLVYQLNVQVTSWIQLRLIGWGVETDADVTRTFKRLRALGKYMPEIPKVEWAYKGHKDLVKWGHGVYQVSWCKF